MPQLFSRAADAWMRMVLLSIVGVSVVAVAVLLTVVRSPYITGQNVTVRQPVPFSHQHHVADAGIDCRYCHTTVEVSPSAGLPSTEICMKCHRALWTDAPMLSAVRASWRTGQPLKWNKVHDLPDFTYFNHSLHVRHGIGCYSCHGRTDEMALVRQAAPMTMQWCLECHRNPAEHVRPRSLVYAPKPLSELTHRPEYRAAVQEALDEPDENAEAGVTANSGRNADPHDRFAEPQLSRLREALAGEYAVKRQTDCYTCHR